MKFAGRMNSFMFKGNYDLFQTIDAYRNLPGITHLEFNYPEHLKGYDLKELRQHMGSLGVVHPRNGNQTILGELYDLETDPGESHNLFYDPSYSEVKMRMLELLCDRMAQTIDPLPRRRSFW